MADRQRLEQTFAVTVDPESVAAIIIELELGEGGFVPAPREYIAALSDFARSHGILLIADEIQTGFARTGKMFACEHYDLEPDLIVTAKSLAGGLPLAAVTGRADVMEASHPGGLGGTYGGNPLACAAALAVIDAMAREELPARAQRLGSLMRERLRCLAEQDQGIGDVRGLGAMVAIELVTDRATRAPDKARTTRVLSEALQQGLLLLSAGTLGNVVRILAPVSIADDVAEEGLAVLAQALAASRG
jgi:4-aminobutyrate aminotransferase-like enzyme